MATDVSDADQVAAMITTAHNSLSAVDIMVHNVGVFPSSTIVKMKEAEWDQVIDTNLKSLFLVCKAALPHMTRRN
jgi:3-oxoacyl-[acyl-carrier protein] reductase